MGASGWRASPRRKGGFDTTPGWPKLSARTLVSQYGVPKSGLWEGFSGAPTAVGCLRHQGHLGGFALVEEAVPLGRLRQGQAVAEDKAPLQPAHPLQGQHLGDVAGDVGQGAS